MEMALLILSIILIAASLFGLPYINNTNDFLDKSFNNIQKEISTYNLIVLNSSNYTSKEELENKKVQVKNYLDAMGMKGTVLRYEQEKILKSCLKLKWNLKNRRQERMKI